MITINLSVTDFSLPSPRQGSIDALSGFGRATQLGQEIHSKIQKKRLKEDKTYQSEVAVSRQFSKGDFLFNVNGRMDGFIPGATPTIEEIKTTFNIHELAQRLNLSAHHPYRLQLQTYGYIYWLEHQIIPLLSFHLVSTRNYKFEQILIPLDVDDYQAWLERRLEELVQENIRAQKRARRRKQASEILKFPFPAPRPGQGELIRTIEEGMKDKKPMLLQAPTGLGKTMGVLYPTLKEAMARGQKVIYVTPKNGQHQMAEEAMMSLCPEGIKIKSLTITAKSKICPMNEPLCNPQYCPYAKDHYTKLATHGILELLAKKRRLTTRVFKKMAKDFEICPFETQLDAAQEADAIICDYNYVFAPRTSFGRLNTSGSLEQEGSPNLVIDECHNLPSRSMDYYSPGISSETLRKIGKDMEALPFRFQQEALAIIAGCLACINDVCSPSTLKAIKISPKLEPFHEIDGQLRSFLNRYLESDVTILPRDPVLRLAFYWTEFTLALEFSQEEGHEEFFVTFRPGPEGGTIKITCCDASKMLEESYKNYENVIGFSATLRPFDYYARLSGLLSDTLKTAEFPSPFPSENRKLLIIPQISSKYSQRERNYPRIAETIQRICALRRGNYLAFFPSFDFLNKVYNSFSPPEGHRTFRQSQGMRREGLEEILQTLKGPGQATIIFAVQGGIFAEGIDYPGEMVIGAFIVGPPLPSFDIEREGMRQYYDKSYADGMNYAYAYPAMAKAIQAAGRVIRSENDRGIIILMDDRFLQASYASSMPGDWFSEGPHELVSTSILKDISDFWSGQKLLSHFE